MFKTIITASVTSLSLALSIGAFAATPDFSPLATPGIFDEVQPAPGEPGHGQPGHGGPGNKLHECMCAGWQAAAPSEEQNTQAHDFMMAAKAVVDAHKADLQSGIRNLFLTWAKHPISKDDVHAAEAALHDHIVPVKDAIESAQIDTLNLLSIDQRGAFDHAFIDCMKQH